MAHYWPAKFECNYDEANFLVSVLERRYPHSVIVGTFFAGWLHYEIEIDDRADRLCAEEAVSRVLATALSRRRPPTDPPPDEAA